MLPLLSLESGVLSIGQHAPAPNPVTSPWQNPDPETSAGLTPKTQVSRGLDFPDLYLNSTTCQIG